MKPANCGVGVVALTKYEITDMVETLSATLAVIVGFVLVIAVSWITGQERVLGAVREFQSTITLCVSGGAMLGSLYFSEVANYIRVGSAGFSALRCTRLH